MLTSDSLKHKIKLDFQHMKKFKGNLLLKIYLNLIVNYIIYNMLGSVAQIFKKRIFFRHFDWGAKCFPIASVRKDFIFYLYELHYLILIICLYPH